MMGSLWLALLWLALAVVAAIVSVWWSSRLWKRRKQLRLRVKIVAVVVAASAITGALGTVAGLVIALNAVYGEGVDPSQQASTLAEGLSDAMNYSFLGVLVCVP